jgi:DNA-binding MarR family transcriptional regulator
LPPVHHKAVDAVDAAEALAAVAPLATRWIERLLAGHDPPLTVPQYLALRVIAREGVSGSELARRTGVSGPAVSQLLAGLADAGLLERHELVEDRRRNALTLSPRGERAFHSAAKLLRERLATLLVELPRPEVDALSRLLPRVESALSGTAPPRRPPPPPPPRPRRRPKP